MRTLPPEFADLLSPKGRRILDRGLPNAAEIFSHPRLGEAAIVVLPGAIDPEKARAVRALLDGALHETLRAIRSPIPPEAITGMRRNYSEKLPKTLRLRTAYFKSRRSASYRAAAQIGLLAMMRSESFAAFAAAATGLPLESGHSIQVIEYQAGDHSGPHTDHHPESPNARHGFVDLHVMLTNEAVAHQWLVCERGGYLSESYDIATDGTIAVYRLPFWHYTTPLAARKGHEAEARRWLLLGTFDLERS
jgi:hypothetical protein